MRPQQREHRDQRRLHPVQRVYTPYTQIDPPVRSSDYNRVFYDPAEIYQPGKKSDGTPLPCEGSNTTCSGAVDLRLHERIRRLSRRQLQQHDRSRADGDHRVQHRGDGGPLRADHHAVQQRPVEGRPDTVWCWKSSPTAAEGRPPIPTDRCAAAMAAPMPRVTFGGNTTPAITAGYNYPNASATCSGWRSASSSTPITAYGNPYYYTIARSSSARGATGWGTSRCGTRHGLQLHQVRPLCSQRQRRHVRAAGLHARRHQAVRLSSTAGGASRRRSGMPERPHRRAGDGQFRQLVRVLPDADAVDEGGLRHRVLGVGTKLPRRLPHALGEQSATAGFTNVKDFTAANKQTWLTNAYTALPTGGTPLPNAMWRIGELFAAIWRAPACRARPIRSTR